MKLELIIDRIEMSENTIRRIMCLHQFKTKFEYMSKYRLLSNDNIKENQCRIVYTNGLSQIMNIEI